MSCHHHYRHSAAVRLAVTGAAGLAALALFVADIAAGTSGLPFSDALSALFAGGDSPAAFIVREIRIPTALTALLVGAALALAGLFIQTITANPLASPTTLGITSGASFGAALAITFGWTVAGELWLGTMTAAFAAALLISGAILQLAHHRSMSPAALILAGIVMNFFFMAIEQLLVYLASPETAQLINGWTFGNLERSGRLSAAAPAAAIAAALVLMAPVVWQLTALSMGEERARSLGVPVAKLRLAAFASASLLIAAAVSFIGTIAFVGLVAPHIAKMLLGDDQRFLIPTSAFTGGALLSASSLIAKALSSGSLLPVGIVTSLVGVPFLFLLLLKNQRGF